MKFVIVILGSLIILLPFILLYLYLTDDMDTCLDVGYCKEGLPLNVEGKEIIITEQTCKDNNGIWYSDKKVCQFK